MTMIDPMPELSLYPLPKPLKWPLGTRLQRMDSRIIRCHLCGAQTMKEPDRLCSHCRKTNE